MGHTLTYYVAENPWYLVAVLGLVAAGFLVALRATQDGRYLVRALVVMGVAGALLVVEQLWVTDAERVEWVVRELADAVARSDGEAALALMDDHVTFGMRSITFGEELVLSSIADLLREVRFDLLRVSRLVATAGAQTHRGQAEFKVTVAGTFQQGMVARNFAGNSEWSLGFRRDRSGAWKINRITAVELPQYTMVPILKYRVPQTGAQPPTDEPVSPPPTRRGFGRGRRGP